MRAAGLQNSEYIIKVMEECWWSIFADTENLFGYLKDNKI